MINHVGSVPDNVFSNFQRSQNDWYLNTPQQNKKKNNKIVPAIAASALVIGFGTLALMKGAVSKKITQYLGKLKTKLERKAAQGGKLANFYNSSVKNINSFLKKTQSLNNITSLKDILFQKLMFTTRITKKIHTNITKFFNKISRKTVNSSYASTDREFANLNEYLLALNEQLIRKNPNNSGLINRLKQKMVGINETFNKGFGVQARTNRLSKLEKATEDLYDYMWNASYSDIKNFRSKNMYQTFIAEEKMLPFKKSIAEEVGSVKASIYDDIAQNMEEYKKILPESKYNELEKRVKSFKKSLEKSIKNETVKYVDKARDLKLGSAPTDILSILFATGTVGWFLGKSKDKDEKISSSLKYGIPVIGAVATTLLCTAKLISGGKSMGIGLLSGWLMSKAGSFVDQVRKQYELDVSLERRSLVKPQSDKV